MYPTNAAKETSVTATPTQPKPKNYCVRNDSKRRQVAEEWSKAYNNKIIPKQINCNGCLPGFGIHQQLHICEIRKCRIARKIQNCAYCVDNKCEKLTELHKNAPRAKKTLEEIRKLLNK